MFLHDNALNTQAFPSLAAIQSRGRRHHRRPAPRRRRRRRVHDLGRHREHPVRGQGGPRAGPRGARHHRAGDGACRPAPTPRSTRPPTTSASRVHKVPVRDDWRADVDAMAAVVNDEHRARRRQRAAVPAGRDRPDPRAGRARRRRSAPTSTPTRAWAASSSRSWRSSARTCRRGTSGSRASPRSRADLHKLGYAPKGASVLLHRTKELRRYQTFVFDDWLGGFYASPACRAPGPALPMATAWAMLHHLGIEGYLRLTAASRSTPASGWSTASGPSTGLAVLGEPEAQLVAIGHRAGLRGRARRVRGRRRAARAAAGTTTARSRPTRCTPPSAPATPR